MASTLDYSTTAGSNTSVGGVSTAEGMQAGLVNNAMRAMMADSRKWQLDWSGVTTAGAANAFTLTSNQGIAAYVDGMRFSFRADRANTGDATLNVDTRGAKNLRRMTSSGAVALAANEIATNGIYDVVYLSGPDVFVVLSYTDGIPASVQTALNAKQPLDGTLTTLSALALVAGDTLYATAADTLARLAIGTAFQKQRVNSAATALEYVGGETALTSTASGGPYLANIPAGTRKITVLMDRCSLDSTGSWFVQIGPSSGVVTTGYESTSGDRANGLNATSGFVIRVAVAAQQITGRMTLELMDSATNLWVAVHQLSTTSGSDGTIGGSGRIALSGTLERFRLTFTAANNPDFGQFKVIYE